MNEGMTDEQPKKRSMFFSRPGKDLGYLAEVTLIIFSILFAFWIERFREGWEEDKKLEQYFSEIQEDLKEEIQTSKMNRYDCENDIKALLKILELSETRSSDSTALYRSKFLSVYYRGVFRTFAPTTADVMANNGDLELIKDHTLRKLIVSTFSFRKEVADEFTAYNLAVDEAGKILYEEIRPDNSESIKPDPTLLYRGKNTNAVFSLYRRAAYKGFMLDNYIEELKELQKQLSKLK
jgi:hypothetical protein